MAHGSTSNIGIKHTMIDFIGGTLGGTALVYVGQPFDTIKVKMQTFPTLYTNMIDCFKQTFKIDGIAKGLYAGTVPAIAANVAENSVLFAGYGFCQKLIMNFNNITVADDLTTAQNAAAGFWAAGASSLTLCPTELIKCKLQAMRETNMASCDKIRVGPIQLTRQIIQVEGIGGLFNGLGATLLREMPGYFFFFGGYEASREFLRAPDQHKDEIGLVKTMVSGAVGGTLFWCIIFPADVVKSRMQVTNIKATFRQHCVQMYRHEGVLAFYNGLLPTLCRTGPATAVLFVVYEYTKKWLTALL